MQGKKQHLSTLLCPFCRIIGGKELASVIFEDKQVIGFLPKEMEVVGHTLIIPKHHCKDIFEISEEDLAAVMKVAKRLAEHYRHKLGATGFNFLHASGKSAQQSVGHFHIHLLPRFEDDGINAWPKLPGCKADRESLQNELKISNSGPAHQRDKA